MYLLVLFIFSSNILIHFYVFTLLQPINGLVSESDKVWPNVPVPQTAAIPVPICNGCGTSSDGMMLVPSTSKTGQKYGEYYSGRSRVFSCALRTLLL